MTAILAVLVGVVSSSIVAIFVEWQRQPRLTLTVGDAADHDYRNRGRAAEEMRGLRVAVSNKPLPRALRWLKRDSARNCVGAVHFLYLDGRSLFADAMPGRWVASVEPVAIIGHSSTGETFTFVDYARMSPLSKIDIPAGEAEALDVAVRCDTEADAYGFNNESYQTRWRTPRWKLEKGRYLVEVTVRSEGQKTSAWFHLNNDHSRDQFRLESAQSPQLPMIR